MDTHKGILAEAAAALDPALGLQPRLLRELTRLLRVLFLELLLHPLQLALEVRVVLLDRLALSFRARARDRLVRQWFARPMFP